MKRIITNTFIVLVLFSCENKNNEATIESIIKSENLIEIKKRRELVHQSLELKAQELAKLDEAIRNLDDDKNLPLVKINPIKESSFTHYIEIRGDVDTKENIMITPEMNGLLSQLNVKAGQKVAKGQVLGKIDDGGMSSLLAQAETQLALLRTTFERQSNLWKQKIGSEIQYLQAKTSMESQEKAVAQIKSQLAKTFIKAPFSGTIEDVKVERGQVIAPGVELMRIVNLKDMFVKAQVPEAYLSKLKLNASVEVKINGIDKKYQGKVRQIGNFINPNNRTFTIEISLKDPENLLRPNQVAMLKIEDYINSKAVTIPVNVVLESGDGSKIVYVIENINKNSEGLVKRRKVETGYVSEEVIEVTSGLAVGEEIVVEGMRNLKENTNVRVID
jgi:membrane fusion protein (multidrug efflux system)